MTERNKMYFYTISDGCYSDYRHTDLYHEKEYSNKEFAQFYNQAIWALGKKPSYSGEVAEKMVELFGFELVKVNFEINVDYGYHSPVDMEKVTEEERCFINEDEDESD